MSDFCEHQNIEVLADAEACNDGARVLRLQLRCIKCQRLVIFPGVPEEARPGRPVATLGGRALTLPFAFGGSYIGG